MPIIETRPGTTRKHRSCRIHLPSSKGCRPPAPESGDSSALSEEELVLRCAVCSAVITRMQQAVVINGSHEHAFFNPAGIAFEIRCFRAAPGAAVLGGASGDFTWFPGYCWQVAVCSTCQTHLGWRFTGDTVFFGLIASRLR